MALQARIYTVGQVPQKGRGRGVPYPHAKPLSETDKTIAGGLRTGQARVGGVLPTHADGAAASCEHTELGSSAVSANPSQPTSLGPQASSHHAHATQRPLPLNRAISATGDRTFNPVPQAAAPRSQEAAAPARRRTRSLQVQFASHNTTTSNNR